MLRVEVLGGSIPKFAWKEFENTLRVKKQTLYNILLQPGSYALRSCQWKGLSNTCLRFIKAPHINYLESHGKQAKDPKDT